MENLGATLKYLNGYEITIPERCKALLEAKIYNEEGLDRFRFSLVWEKLNPSLDSTSINLSGNEIKSLKDLPSKVTAIGNLNHLDLSNNKIESINELEKVLEACFKLTILDIRDNLIQSDIKNLISIIKTNCPNLRSLFIERSTRGKDTAVPKQYYEYVFAEFAGMPIQIVDNMKNPQSYGEGPRKITSVFALDWAKNPPQELTIGVEQNSNSSSPEDDIPPPYQFPESSNNTYLQESIYGTPQLYTSGLYPFDVTSNGLSVDHTPSNLYPFSPLAPFSQNEHDNSAASMYPDLSSFTTESYLPKDYHMTIGRKYDISELAQQLAEQNEKDDNDDDDDD